MPMTGHPRPTEGRAAACDDRLRIDDGLLDELALYQAGWQTVEDQIRLRARTVNGPVKRGGNDAVRTANCPVGSSRRAHRGSGRGLGGRSRNRQTGAEPGRPGLGDEWWQPYQSALLHA